MSDNNYPDQITVHRDMFYEFDDEAGQYFAVLEHGKVEQKYVRADIVEAVQDALDDALKLIEQLLDEREKRQQLTDFVFAIEREINDQKGEKCE